MIRISVYDDSPERRESLTAFLRLMPGYEYAGSYANCVHLPDNIATGKPDLILMDIEMPEADGISGLRLVKQQYPHIKVIMQTAFDDNDRLFAALQAGAEGYILKSASVMQIAQGIDEVMNGGATMSPSIAIKVMRYFNQASPLPDYHLSPKETEVLKLLAIGHSYKMIADSLGISYFTVNNHLKKIYEKLQVHSLGEAVALAHRQRLI